MISLWYKRYRYCSLCVPYGELQVPYIL